MKGKRLEFLLLIALFLTVLSVNISVIGGGFLWDDFALIVNNENIRHINLKDFFTKGFWENAEKGIRTGGYYRPLILLSYAIDYKLYRLHPWGYHLTNLIVFLLSIFLLFLVIKRIENNFLLAFIGTVFFGLHPMAKEPMGWIAGRTDLFAGFFLLFSLLLFLHYLEKRKLWLVSLSLLFFLLAMFSKEASYIYPLFIVALILYKYRERFWKLIPEILSFGIIALGIFVLSVKISLRPGAFYPPRAYDFLSNALKTLGFYFTNAILPLFTSPVPDFVKILSTGGIFIWIGLVFLGLLLLFPFQKTRKIGFYASSGLIFLIPALAPLVLTTPTPIANRFAYISLFFLSLLPFLILERLFRGKIALVLVLALLVPTGSLSLKFSRLYSSEGQFWANTYRMSPNSPVVHVNYASYLVKIGKYREALELLKGLSRGKNIPLKLLLIKAQVESKAHFLLGNFEKGEEILLKALQYPFYASRDAFLFLVNFYSITRQLDRMRDISEREISAGVRDLEVYHSIAYAEIVLGDYEKAQNYIKKITDDKIVEELKKLETNMKRLEKRAEEDPYSRALLLFLRGNLEEAMPIVETLLKEAPHNPDYLILYLKIKVVMNRFKGLKELLNFIVENSKTYKTLDRAFSYFWFQWMAPKPAIYILEKSLEKFPNQPHHSKKRIILNYIKEEIQGG